MAGKKSDTTMLLIGGGLVVAFLFVEWQKSQAAQAQATAVNNLVTAAGQSMNQQSFAAPGTAIGTGGTGGVLGDLSNLFSNAF